MYKNKSPTYPTLYSFKSFFSCSMLQKEKKKKHNKHDHDVRHPPAYLTAGLTACRPVSLSVCYFRCCFWAALQDFGLYVKVLCVWESCNCVCNCLLSNASATATATTLWQQLQRRATHDSEEDVFI